MYYTRSMITGGFVVICVVTYALFVFFWSRDGCPVGTFPCSNKNVCVPQRSVCNNYKDCPNGDDEDPVLCNDLNGSVNMVYGTYNKTGSKSTHNEFELVCDISEYPDNCKCKYRYRLICKNINLSGIPQNISENVTHLILPNNTIQTLQENSFSRYHNLKLIHLEGNNLLNLPSKIFSKQKNLLRLFLMNNKLQALQTDVFDGLHQLLWLIMYNNHLQFVDVNCFKDLQSLEWLDLSHNELILENQSFPPLLNLLELFLNYNKISEVTKYMFVQLKNLELLNLGKNQISILNDDAFGTLKNLLELNLDGNRLKHLSSQLFTSLPLLSKLYLGNNPLHYIPGNLFHKLPLLASLNLEEIEINNIDVTIFSQLKSLESVYFKKYHYCEFAPTVPHCRPLSDGVSSTYQLLEKPILRYATWITCFITFIGNILVLWGRITIHDENRVLSVVVRNLAASDLLMGIYLLIIGFHDLKYRDRYNQEAHEWKSSWLCTISGILAMISSEVSVLLIVFMSIERFFLIAVPFGHYYPIKLKPALIILFSIWIIGLGLAIIPAIEFLSSTRYYGLNGLCFPLHIDEPFFLGWKYSALIILGINSLSLLLIMVMYCLMFLSIWKTRHATSLPVKDYDIAIRFFFIVLTDSTCWLPIILAKLFAIFGMEISGDFYGWLVVFVLPINSALNPILYTFTTPKYRSKVYKLNIARSCVMENNKMDFLKDGRCQSNLDTGSTPTVSGHQFNISTVKKY